MQDLSVKQGNKTFCLTDIFNIRERQGNINNHKSRNF